MTAHLALLYATDAEYVEAVGVFVREGVERGEPVLLALPGERLALLRSVLDATAPAVATADMRDLGRNPRRIIPAIRSFLDAHPRRPARFVGEPIWDGRTAAEIHEAEIHEALLNRAFAGAEVTILCPYSTGLADGVLAEAAANHPGLIDASRARPSREYREGGLSPRYHEPLARPPAGAAVIDFGLPMLGDVRRLTARVAGEAGLRDDRLDDYVLAVNEVATNSVRHATPPASLAVWHAGDLIVSQISDGGRLADPLVGRLANGEGGRGRGLPLVDRLCDLVEIRSTDEGTTVQLTVRGG